MASINKYGTVGRSGESSLIQSGDTSDQSEYREGNADDYKQIQNGQPGDLTLGPLLTKQILNKGTEEELVCIGYRDNLVQVVFFWILVILSGGLLLLVMYWKPDWKVKMMKQTCPLKKADTVVLKDLFAVTFNEDVVLVTLSDGPVMNTYASCDNLDTSCSKYSGEFAYLDSDGGSGGSDVDDTTTLTIRAKVYLKYFDHKHVRFMWDQNQFIFRKVRGLESGLTCGHIHEKCTGLTSEEQAHRLQIFGKNIIDVPVKSYFRLLFQEILNPFYVFQIASVILWSLDDYYIYAGCIVFISAISLGVELYETRKQSKTLHDMVMSAASTATVVMAGGAEVEVDTKDLVPGDVMIVPAHGCMMSCDAVLVSGTAIVNESMLTGESVPVTKTALSPSESDEMYTPDTHKRHTLFSGTQVIQTRYYGEVKVRAVVVRTGFYTAKGDLVRSILFPKPMGFKFYKDSMKFIGFLACVAIIGMIYSICILIRNGEVARRVVLRALDIVTIVVPPALPAAMTVGTAYAQSRLKKQGIFCISPPRINIAGKLKLFVFDKTGTLTEEGLDLWGVVPVVNKQYGSPTNNPTVLSSRSPFIIAMATCHSLTIIDNELTGDPLDLKMFQSINWLIEEPGRDTSKFDNLMPTVVKPIHKSYGEEGTDECPFEVGIVRQFTFSSSLQRMSVLVRVLGADQMDVYAKGAPEKIASLCKKDTLPEDFAMRLHKYTMQGYRVIALAWKPLDAKLSWHQAQRLNRDQIESELTFLGLLIMENMLKPQTTPVIKQLHTADIRTVMATGDNILTAVSVAHQCGMILPKERVVMVNAQPPDHVAPAKIEWELATMETIPGEPVESDGLSVDTDITDMPRDTEVTFVQTEMCKQVAVPIHPDADTNKYHFALTGRNFSILRQYFPDLLPKICARGTVFARMSPEQKSQLVELLQDLGYGVGMCGDGANDCGALKTAHVGISLSEAEASVASPFTSKTPHIECVPTLIREGRAALVTSFGVFKYMALYSIIQFVSVLILYTKETNLSDVMFLYIDLIITTTVAFLMGHTAAYPSLVAKRPPGSLVGPINMFSIIMHILIVGVFQACAFFYLATESWYIPNVGGDTNNNKTFETTTIFYISTFQYLMLAFIFSKGPPYRKPIWTNIPFLVALILLLGLTTFIVLYPLPFIAKILELVDIPTFIFRLTIIGLAGINFFIAVILESFIIPSRSFARCTNAIRRKRQPKNKYKVVLCELERNPYWPPLGEITLSQGGGLGRDRLTGSVQHRKT